MSSTGLSPSASAATDTNLRLSEMADHLIGSEIIKLSSQIRDRIAEGEKIYNFTIGDFDPEIFPIPADLKDEIIRCYNEGKTNYPAANGNPELRESVSRLIHAFQHLDYSTDEILIAGGARPVIYAVYQTVVNPGDKVVFPVPSWNNNHYVHLSRGEQVFVETCAENNFLPTAEELKPHISGAALLALCSPLNPTGTVFKKQQLEDICDLILEENRRRDSNEKPLYLMYDQIYSQLILSDTKHFDPVNLRPEMRAYTIFVDGISKSLAATGVRVGWAFGPRKPIDRMKSILGHIGAWAPRPEQIATGRFLAQPEKVGQYLNWIRSEIADRLNIFYDGIMALHRAGFPVYAIAPKAAIYLTVQVNLKGRKLPDGSLIQTTEETTAYLLKEAHIALVPFYAFGSNKDSNWYRLSVGTAKKEDAQKAIEHLTAALKKLG